MSTTSAKNRAMVSVPAWSLSRPRTQTCEECDGTGLIDDDPCEKCAGRGTEDIRTKVSCSRCLPGDG